MPRNEGSFMVDAREERGLKQMILRIACECGIVHIHPLSADPVEVGLFKIVQGGDRCVELKAEDALRAYVP